MSTKKDQKDQRDTVKTKPTIARLEDGTVQVTLTIPQEKVQKARETALVRLVENLEIPGFRKGKAPTDVALKHIEKQKIFDQTLQILLPDAYVQAIQEHSLQPITGPRFELLSTNDDSDWSIRVVICELPQIDLGDYKNKVTGAVTADKIWVPGKDKEEKQPTQEEKEQLVLKTLLENTEVRIPRLLIEDEVNHRLSQLIDQTQKLGLTVEQYLTSTGKSIDQVKKEYELQANDSIKILLLLNKVAEEEKITISDGEIKEVVEAGMNATGGNSEASEEQKRYIRSMLLRRKALDTLASLI